MSKLILIGMDAVVRVKDERLNIIKDALALYKCRKVDKEWIITTDKLTSVETLWKIMHKSWDIENNVFHQLKTEWHLKHCFLHSPTGIETVLMLIIMAFNLMQLYFFRCIRGFRKKNMFQIDVIEDLRDEIFTIENDWNNPIFEKT